MKKTLVLMAAIAIVLAIGASSAKADTTACSKSGIVSTERSSTELFTVTGLDFMAVTVNLVDKAGAPICGEEVEVSTSRNTWAPNNGWPKDVDQVWTSKKISDYRGQATFIISTDNPAGTTIMVVANGWLLRDQRPFSWGDTASAEK